MQSRIGALWALHHIIMINHLHSLLRTGTTPIATIMRKLLTEYAVSSNLPHHYHSDFFQNRFKSILCQEDLYLKELIRYIHLNPLQAGIGPRIKWDPNEARYNNRIPIMKDIVGFEFLD
jgi:REP element-mobilizing transposase RayT